MTGCHIPHFGRPYHNYLTEYGTKTAHDLLRKLYTTGAYITTHLAALREGVHRMDAAIASLNVDDFPTAELLRGIRRELRQELHAGKLTPVQYQQRLLVARRKHRNYECEIWRLEETFFSSSFPFIVSVDLRDYVLIRLRSEGRE